MTIQPLNVLIVDDSADDATLLQLELKRGGFDLTSERVQTAAALRTALGSKSWDLIISDYAMPQFDGLTALQICQASGQDIPFILVSGQVGEDVAVQAMKTGAHDFLLKHNLTRLVPAVRRELQEAQGRHRRRLAEQALAASEEKYRLMIENAQDAIYRVDLEGRLTFVNTATAAYFACGAAELTGKTVWDLFPARADEYYASLRRVIDERTDCIEEKSFEINGRCYWFSTHLYPVYDAQGQVCRVQAIARDITERRLAEQQLRLWGRVIQVVNSGVMIADCTQPGLPLISVNPAFETITGYTAAEVIGRNPRFLQGADRNQAELIKLREALANHQECQVILRNYRKDGTQFWGEMFIAPMRDERERTTHIIGVLSDITERKEYEAQLEHSATHDALTGLPNRLLLHDRLTHAITQARRTQWSIAVLYVDLDRFKTINDGLGHAVGDALLQATANRLRASVRESDTVARHSGDEFIVLLERIKPEETAILIAQKVLNALRRPFVLDGHELFLSASIGVSCYPKDGLSAEQLLRHADNALYQAKDRSRDGVQVYDQTMEANTLERLQLDHALHHAVGRGELEVHYQPQVALASGRIIGAEALLRWRHPQHGLISPALFIPLAEETGLITVLGAWVLETACLQAKAWQAQGLPPLRLAVNLSARQFLDQDLAKQVAGMLDSTGFDACRLELEITESTLMKDVDQAIEVMQALRDMGIGLAIDDFGTGYSSLSYLKRFPLDRLKIDRSFVKDIATDPNAKAIVEAVIAMARSLRLGVIAEGVETAEQLAFLQERNCAEIQGYYFSPPVNATAFGDLLRANGQPEKV